MKTANKTIITIATTVNAPMAKVWESWNKPEHIIQWCQASADWHAPYADNDLRTGGNFKTTMAAKDGSFSFDFGGVYTDVREHQLIKYTMDDGREVAITFAEKTDGVEITEAFEAENMNSIEMQRGGWQSIMESFKKYTEAL